MSCCVCSRRRVSFVFVFVLFFVRHKAMDLTYGEQVTHTHIHAYIHTYIHTPATHVSFTRPHTKAMALDLTYGEQVTAVLDKCEWWAAYVKPCTSTYFYTVIPLIVSCNDRESDSNSFPLSTL